MFVRIDYYSNTLHSKYIHASSLDELLELTNKFLSNKHSLSYKRQPQLYSDQLLLLSNGKNSQFIIKDIDMQIVFKDFINLKVKKADFKKHCNLISTQDILRCILGFYKRIPKRISKKDCNYLLKCFYNRMNSPLNFVLDYSDDCLIESFATWINKKDFKKVFGKEIEKINYSTIDFDQHPRIGIGVIFLANDQYLYAGLYKALTIKDCHYRNRFLYYYLRKLTYDKKWQKEFDKIYKEYRKLKVFQ